MKNYFFYAFLACSLILTSCKKDETEKEPIGPDICPEGNFSFAADDLKIDGLTSNQIDLSSKGLHITATFSQVIKWTMTISGGNSKKVYSEESNAIDVWWYGNAESLPFFQKGATSIKLEIPCNDDIVKNFEVTGDPSFKNTNKAFGVMLRDWDKNGFFPVLGTAFDPADGWQGFSTDTFDTQEFSYPDANPSPMGGRHLKYYGKIKNGNTSWYLGGHSFPVSGLPNALGSVNADELYLNIYLKPGKFDNSSAQIGFKHNDTNYFYIKELANSADWALHSFKLSSFKDKDGNPFTAVDANTSDFILQLGPSPEKASELEINYDFAFISVKEPLITK